MALPPISRPRKAAVAGFIALSLLASAGYAVREWPAWHAARDARRALADSRHGVALKATERWLRQRPRSAEAHFLHAKAALALGRRRDLVDGMLRARPSDIPRTTSRFARLRGDEAGALGHLDRAIALRPFDPAPRHNRRIALGRLGRPAEARQEQEAMDLLKVDLDGMDALRERIDASPDDAGIQARLARWMFAHGYDQEGLKWAEKILNEHPGHRETCSLLVSDYETRGNHEQAAYYQSRMASPARR